ncbi:MAG: hypothetical protein JNL79_36505 [Myxococcales bacterium]|nr:hypothetical protein [Myxococcales bacterium]
MPRTLPFAGALVLLVLASTHSARADELDVVAPSPSPSVSVRPSAYLGLLSGRNNGWSVLGLETMVLVDNLRLGGFAEVGSQVFGGNVATFGGTVGIGSRPDAGPLDFFLGVEGGTHHYSKLGDDLFATTIAGGSATLPFAGARATATYYFGKSRRFGLGLTAFARADLSTREVATTTTSGFFENRTESHLERAGFQNVGAALRFAVAL